MGTKTFYRYIVHIAFIQPVAAHICVVTVCNLYYMALLSSLTVLLFLGGSRLGGHDTLRVRNSRSKSCAGSSKWWKAENVYNICNSLQLSTSTYFQVSLLGADLCFAGLLASSWGNDRCMYVNAGFMCLSHINAGIRKILISLHLSIVSDSQKHLLNLQNDT